MNEHYLRKLVESNFATLKPAPKLGHKFWVFINSSLGLWLLSSVVVAGFGSWLTAYLKESEQKAAHELKVSRIKVEIAYRLRPMEQALNEVISADFPSDVDRSVTPRIHFFSHGYKHLDAFTSSSLARAPIDSGEYFLAEFLSHTFPFLFSYISTRRDRTL